MKERTENRITGWGSLLISILLIGIPVLSAFIDGLSNTISIRLWAFLCYVLFIVIFILLLIRHYNKKNHDAIHEYTSTISIHENERSTWLDTEMEILCKKDELAEELTKCQEEIIARDQLEFLDGAYFRKSDKRRDQPFCRICYDTDKMLVTVAETIQHDGYNTEHLFDCPRCKTVYTARVKLLNNSVIQAESNDDNIPF